MRAAPVIALAAILAAGAASGALAQPRITAPGTYDVEVKEARRIGRLARSLGLTAGPNTRAFGDLLAGDVNGDGVPDFLMLNSLYLFVGSVSGANSPAPYTLSYTAYPVQAPPGGYSGFGASIAIGDLDGDGADEIAVGAAGGGKKNPVPPVVFIYKFGAGGLTNVQTIQEPNSSAAGFGGAIAIGNIDGNPGNDLVVGAPGASTPNGGAA